jgi:hypothetical protein
VLLLDWGSVPIVHVRLQHVAVHGADVVPFSPSSIAIAASAIAIAAAPVATSTIAFPPTTVTTSPITLTARHEWFRGGRKWWLGRAGQRPGRAGQRGLGRARQQRSQGCRWLCWRQVPHRPLRSVWIVVRLRIHGWRVRRFDGDFPRDKPPFERLPSWAVDRDHAAGHVHLRWPRRYSSAHRVHQHHHLTRADRFV